MLDISKLQSGSLNKLEFNENFTFSEEDLKEAGIQRVKDITAKGTVLRVSDDTYHIEMNIKGTIVLLCSRSLEEVDYPVNINIDKTITEGIETDEKPIILQNSLDIFSIVWENIVTEVPLRVIKEDATFITKGEGWSLMEEGEKLEDNPFSDLKSMLDMEGKE